MYCRRQMDFSCVFRQQKLEKKKGAIGVRGIRLKKDDALTNVYLFEEGTECKISYHEKEVTLNRLKLAKRDGTGTKYRG